MTDNMEVEYIDIIAVSVGERLRRSLNPDTVERLKQSIEKIGLKTPISVRDMGDEEGWLLVAGSHRLKACTELGWETIPARIETGSESDARMWEIAENLHRAELTVLERSEHIAEWIKLAEERQPAQVAPSVLANGRIAGHQHKESGINAASRELGIERTQAQRSVKVASLPETAKEVAREAGLDNNRSALLAAAKAVDPETEIRRIAADKEERALARAHGEPAPVMPEPAPAPVIPEPEPITDVSDNALEEWVQRAIYGSHVETIAHLRRCLEDRDFQILSDLLVKEGPLFGPLEAA